MKNPTFSSLLLIGLIAVWNTAFAAEPSLITQSFTENTTTFPNPERGWIVHRYSNDMYDLAALRGSTEKVSMVLIKIDIGQYRYSTHIGSIKLDEIRAALTLCRKNGVKALLRSAYSWDEVLAPDPTDINLIVTHVQDMKPIYNDFKDVIVAVEMGMFGPWGEMHSSSQSTVSNQFYYPVKTSALKSVHSAYMSALPPDRSVLLRRPYYIREIFGSDVPLDSAEAYKTTPKARTGYHNDAYLNSEDEGGTFDHEWSREQELTYINKMSLYSFFGGETFGTPNDTYNNAVNAKAESKRQHMTYLHRDYYTPIYDAWGSSVKNEFTRKLGYRFALESVSYSQQVAPGGVFDLTVKLHNSGYSAAHLTRPVELVIDNGSEQYRTTISVNHRQWTPEAGAVSFNRKFRIPANIAQGNWKVYMALPDPDGTLKNNAKYAVRLANDGVWDSRGMNLLTSSLPITADAPGSKTADTEFKEISASDTEFKEISASAPTQGVSNTVAIKSVSAINLEATYVGNYSYRQAYIDVDNNKASGYLTNGIGAEFLIENGSLYKHFNSGWSWKYIGEVGISITGEHYQWSVPLSILGANVTSSSRVTFAGSTGSTAQYSNVLYVTVQ